MVPQDTYDLRPSCSGPTPLDTATLPSVDFSDTDNPVARDKPTPRGGTKEDTDVVVVKRLG